MRVAPILAILLLAGCADQDASSGAQPWRETRGEWTLVVEPGVLQGAPGERVEATVRLEGPRGATGQFSLNVPWMDPSRPRIVVEDGRASFAASVYVGAAERLSAFLLLGPPSNDQESVSFEGPPIPAVGVVADAAVARHAEVSAHPAGLSVEVEGRAVRVVFAARDNATTTSGEVVDAHGPLLVAEVEGRTHLVLFVMRMFSDAVAPLPEPTRSRVEATVEDLPPGEVHVQAVAAVSCFCFELDPPVVHEARVVVG